jgi:predicted transglutaminase-like cysteine proteinase
MGVAKINLWKPPMRPICGHNPIGLRAMLRLVMIPTLLITLSACNQTASVGTAMQVSGYAFPPPAFNAFCEREPRFCRPEKGNNIIEMTTAREEELEAVNASVNRRIRERSDLQTSGNADYWQLPSTQGDCEDFAILKKSELLKRGWPASILLLTVARLGDGGHTVLTVRTSKGDKVLDNRTNAIRDWSNTPYRYFARQSQSAAGKWDRIQQQRSL